MFKLGFKQMGRDSYGEKRDQTTGHDRFCTSRQKIQLPRYRRRRNPHRRTQAETDLVFELTSYSGDSSESPTDVFSSGHSGGGGRIGCEYQVSRRVNEIQWPSHTFQTIVPAGKPLICPPEPDHTMFLQNHCADHVHQLPYGGGPLVSYDSNQEDSDTSWGSISKFFSLVAMTLTCRNNRKDSSKYASKQRMDQNRPTNYDYNRLGDESGASEMVELHSSGRGDEMKLKSLPPHHGLIRSEKMAGHNACMKYLKSSNGRYVLLDQLPEIGWRTNRLWYVICDARVNAKRLLVATPCNPRSPIVDSSTKSIMMQVCRALQHPYVCPVLELETVTVENFDRPFSLIVTPVAPRGSLRDIFHNSQWADHWPNKYSRRGNGLSEGHAQRLSCHILEALLELRLRGLPAGIGGHLHPGNVLIQHGTARFSGLDNVLMGHNPRALPFISRYINTNLEAIDSISFAYILFAMCAGYEVVTAKLTPQNWNDIRDYAQATQVLEFILDNPENRIPTLKEIANLDFYRTVDLRELRSLPLPNIMAGPPLPPVRVLLDHLHSNKLTKGKKSRSTSAVCDGEKSSSSCFPGQAYEPPRSAYTDDDGFHPRSFSISTPSIYKAQKFSSDSLTEGNTSQHDESASGSSQVSIYCTPPSSLDYASKPSASSAIELALSGKGRTEPVGNVKTI